MGAGSRDVRRRAAGLGEHRQFAGQCLGTIAKVVASGESIYATKLPFAEAERRIFTYWRPFHDTLTRLIQDIRARFGYCLLIDCHSMPSNALGKRAGGRAIDFVLGDLHGSACASRVTRTAEALLTGKGYLVRRNDPYAGGYITRHYGKPADDVHVLQVEVARALYMDEVRIERLPDFPFFQRQISDLVAAMTLQVHDLPVTIGGNAHVADQHVRKTSWKEFSHTDPFRQGLSYRF